MKRFPLPILFVSAALIIAGTVGFFYHLQDFANPGQAIYITILVECLRILAIVSGILLLRANVIGKWFPIGWVLLHVIISAFHSIEETVVHIGVFIVVTVLLYLPVSSAFLGPSIKKVIDHINNSFC